jgi:hypothetical protein
MTSSLISPSPTAPLGSVTTLPLYTPSDFCPGSLILCRNSAPLVAHAYALLQRDVPCIILGRDIGAALITIIRKMRGAHLPDLRGKLLVWHDREVGFAEREGRDAVAERIHDQYACLIFFINSLDEDSQTIPDLITKIELMFTDDNENTGNRVTLATIHKAKGLEFPTVFFLDRNLIPSRYAKQPWQKEQERNLLYVGITRAKLDLVYINSGNWKIE